MIRSAAELRQSFHTAGARGETAMSLILQIVLAVAIAILTVFLVLVLIQARRTAASVQRLADSATQDLHQIATDLHEVRAQVDSVTQLAKGTLELPSLLAKLVAGIVHGVSGYFGAGRPPEDSSRPS